MTLNSSLPIVYVICGPTAVGKTAIAIALAEVKHYFINEFPVTESLSAADYEKLALGYLDEIFKTSGTAVVCGGTGLYIKALCEGLDEMPEADEEMSAEIIEQYKLGGMEWLREAVENEDPAFYESSESENPARLIRALIFKRSTGESILEYRTGEKKPRHFQIVKIGIELPREILYERINKRVDIMMEQGLLDEAKGLYPHKHLKNLQTVGYVELFDYLDGKYSLQEAIAKIKQHTRNYAKRQLTWFRKDQEVKWLNAGDKDIISKILHQ